MNSIKGFLVIVILSCVGYAVFNILAYHDRRPHNNGRCIDNHCLGEQVVVTQLGIKGYISDYYRWKPSQPVEYTVSYRNDIGEAKTIEVKEFELTFKNKD